MAQAIERLSHLLRGTLSISPDDHAKQNLLPFSASARHNDNPTARAGPRDEDRATGYRAPFAPTRCRFIISIVFCHSR
jgi:hypothetical protein